MILHCSQKLAAKLAGVSATPLEETSPLGSWHGHLFALERRQCLILCHDASRYVLFLPGLRKADFVDLGTLFRPLYLATLAAFGAAPVQIKKAELALGPLAFDTVTDRSVQGSIRIVQQEIKWMLAAQPLAPADPLALSCEFNNQRPASVHGKWLWPDTMMLETVARL